MENQSPLSSLGSEAHNVPSEYQIYCKYLLARKRGFPLLDATPHENLPPEYRARGICIGDVGRVTAEGGWDFFFNIYLSAEDDIHLPENGLPTGFSPLPPYNPSEVYTKNIPSGHVTSISVQGHSAELDTGCQRPDGALLALPYGSRQQRLQNTKAMKQLAIQNAESWYEYVNQQRGRDLINGGLYLITGCEKSSSGGMATFQNISNNFDISFTPRPDGDGHTTPYHFFGLGEHPAQTHIFSSGEDRTQSHTVFLYGFSISLGEGIS
ncbi:hypothetical protein C8F01DRAFT_994832 [Mycena amicta]|nr:hypothetical protein C8F01DRAFT_994832 [Mycena amicta]